jgi:hypothetical protein
MTRRARALVIGAVGLLLTADLAIGVAFLLTRSGSQPAMAMPAHPMAMTGRTMSASSCTLVTTTQLAAVVGRVVESPSPRSNPRETSCTYRISSSEQRVRITYSMFVSPRGFGQWADGVKAAGHRTKHLCGIGDDAYLATLPSRHGTVTALSMLVGSTQVLIEAPAPVGRVTGLAHSLVPAV